jgi:lipopolysaccharide transport system ATP-binding protein
MKQGESLGIIGRNGAGKTTLLKIINGLIKPTRGKITIKGKVGALIALGTGFNPILTGRENIKVAGAILGFSSKEMDERLDEIIAFSDIGDFIDAPVKSYSSGMLVRLGFAVAIQLQPDVLLVDEVLAVGDLRFAVKCHKRITEYQNNGGSLILVSHGLHNIRFHCDKAIWLHNGEIKEYGPSHEICNSYEIFTARENHDPGQELYFDDTIKIMNVAYPTVLKSHDPFVFEFTLQVKKKIKKTLFVFSIMDIRGEDIIDNYSGFDGFSPSLDEGVYRVKLKYDALHLSKGVYSITLVVSNNTINDHLAFFQKSFKFEVISKKPEFGLLSLKPEWSISSSI